MAETTNQQIRKFILTNFPLARRKNIRDSDSLLKSGLIDSLGVLTVVTFLEDTFSVKIEDDELAPENFETIDEMSAFVQKKTNMMKAESHHANVGSPPRFCV
jgi:acyl carrier protein